MDAFDLMMYRIPKKRPDASIIGVLVQEMCRKGQEVIVFTGASDKGVETARKGNRAEWMDIIFNWFGIESETAGKSGTPSY